MLIKTILYCLSVTFFMTACTRGHRNEITPDPGPFVAYKNVLYGTDTIQQVMDVSLPSQRDTVNTPVIILLHGGSWVQGDKNDFTGFGLDTFFTANGCALINMNYRLYGSYSYPAPLNDIGLVMDYIKQKSAEWRINPNRVCLFGRSSGSQLALMYAYSRNTDNRIKAVIDGFGPTGLVDSTIVYTSLGQNVSAMLGPYASNMQAWHDASPIFFMQGALPTVIYQGTDDVTVYPVQSLMLQDSLFNRGVPCMFVSWVGDGHGWDEAKWREWSIPTINWIKHFL